jgi:hypothetical protein
MGSVTKILHPADGLPETELTVSPLSEMPPLPARNGAQNGSVSRGSVRQVGRCQPPTPPER